MSASLSDIGLTIIHEGKKSYWAGMKSCGHVLLDIRFGLYGNQGRPDLSWIENGIWGEMLESLPSELEDPVYGTITVDFDKKIITEQNGYGHPLKIIPEWLAMTWEDPDCSPISKKSLRHHLTQGHVRALTNNDQMNNLPGETVGIKQRDGFGDIKARIKILNSKNMDWDNRLMTFVFDLPLGWVLTER